MDITNFEWYSKNQSSCDKHEAALIKKLQSEKGTIIQFDYEKMKTFFKVAQFMSNYAQYTVVYNAEIRQLSLDKEILFEIDMSSIFPEKYFFYNHSYIRFRRSLSQHYRMSVMCHKKGMTCYFTCYKNGDNEKQWVIFDEKSWDTDYLLHDHEFAFKNYVPRKKIDPNQIRTNELIASANITRQGIKILSKAKSRRCKELFLEADGERCGFYWPPKKGNKTSPEYGYLWNHLSLGSFNPAYQGAIIYLPAKLFNVPAKSLKISVWKTKRPFSALTQIEFHIREAKVTLWHRSSIME